MSIAIVGVFVFLMFMWLIERRHRKFKEVGSGFQERIELGHDQEFELYHNSLSLCSMKVRVCLDECGLKYKSHHIDLIETGQYENIRREYLQVNPQGTVPVLVHHGHPIYESHDQISYLGEEFGESGLWPTDVKEHGTVAFWIDQTALNDSNDIMSSATAGHSIPGLTTPLFSAMVASIPTWKILEGVLFHFDKKRPMAFLVMKLLGIKRFHLIKPALAYYQQGIVKIQEHLDELQKQLEQSGGPWIMGDDFTLADVGWVPIFVRLEQIDVLPHLLASEKFQVSQAYYEALKSRPSYQSSILDHQHPAVLEGTRRIVRAKSENPALKSALNDLILG
jgi:glutathione S-transferase